ncbi:bifunctional 3'-5' exonuclease/DNA polymerase [Chlamydia trachomatis]|nr:bifunctional 3'-5' exonuclease/DNA polymerase [Chlamydia trachomatis]
MFSTHGKIYEASASQMFHIPIEDVGKELRQKGKIAELALGYQGGPGALKQMGALEMGVAEDELQGLVDDWRRANPKIVQFWKDVQKAAIKAIRTRAVVKLGRLKFKYRKGFLLIQLPSGRSLAYAKAKLEAGDYGDKIIYEGQGDKAYFIRQETYGGKLVENIVQATARDILAEAILRLEENGYPVVFHVHDECIVESSGTGIETINNLMAQNPEWAEGLPLNSEGYVTKYYKKD